MSREKDEIMRQLQQIRDAYEWEKADPRERRGQAEDLLEERGEGICGGGMPEDPEAVFDYLELAAEAGTNKKKLEYLDKALELEPDNLDALRLQAELKAHEPNALLNHLAVLRIKGEERLRRAGYSPEELEELWLIPEMRPYLRLQDDYIRTLLDCGMMRRAAAEGELLLRLSRSDPLGVRFTLMHIYAYLEEEEAALDLHERCGKRMETQLLLPLAMLFYKAGKQKEALWYLQGLAKVNRDTKAFFAAMCSGRTEKLDACRAEMDPDAWEPDTLEDFIVELEENGFLLDNADGFYRWGRDALKAGKGKG